MKYCLITGSREWAAHSVMRDALAPYDDGERVLVHGAARGADSMAASLWKGPAVSMPADWSRGRGAGHERNRAMVELVKTHDTVAFAFPTPSSRGTWDCVAKMKLAGIEPRIVTP